MKFLESYSPGNYPDWWEDFLQEWNYLVYLRVRKVAWLSFIYPLVAAPTLWAINSRLQLNDSNIVPIVLTVLVFSLSGLSAVLLFRYKFITNAKYLTKKYTNLAIIYIIYFTLSFDVIFAIIWAKTGINSPYLIALFVWSVLFLRPNRWCLVLYGLNFAYYLAYISLFPFPKHVMLVSYVSGTIATILGLFVANYLFQSRRQEFIDRKTIEVQTIELSNAYRDISELNDRLRSENMRMGIELTVAKAIQEAILPKDHELVEIKFLDVAALMSAATEVGGDYFDVLVDHEHQRATIAMGDVTGHGLESGIFTVMIQSAVRLIHHSNKYSAIEAINLLNRLLYENAKRMSSDKSVTFVLLQYDRGEVKICGQHEEIVIVKKDGHLECIDTANLGFPLGLELDISAFVNQQEIYLDAQDVLVLYTDGITEATNPRQEFYGTDRLHQSIANSYDRSAAEIRQNITDNVMDFIDTAPIHDDITLVVLKQI